MSSQTSSPQTSQEDGDKEPHFVHSPRPPVLGQEQVENASEWGESHISTNDRKTVVPSTSIKSQRNTNGSTSESNPNTTTLHSEISWSEFSPTPNFERPLQLCGQSITPSSDQANLLSPNSERLIDDICSSEKQTEFIMSNIPERTQSKITNPLYDESQPSHEFHHQSQTSTLSQNPSSNIYLDLPESVDQSKAATLDFQVPGLGSLGPRFEGLPESDPHADTPPWLRWALALHYLLHDAKGVNLFRKYLLLEGRQHVDALEFWFAVEGLHGQITPETVAQLVKVIYRRYFMKTQLPLDEQMRREVAHKYKLAAPHMLADLFDAAQNHVESLMRRTTYPNFLKSDIYLQYVQSMQNPESSALGGLSGPTESTTDSGELSSGSSGSTSVRDLPPSSGGTGGPLPTVHEDSELVTDYYCPLSGFISTGQRSPFFEPPRLTKDLLLATQKRRALEVRPKPETFAGVPPLSLSAYHAAYSGYNPVSRIDSELQSLSSHSDARTDADSLSLTDLSSIDGSSVQHQRAVKRRQARQARESANINRESSGAHILIPRTQRPPRDHWKSLPPAEFAAILTEKLEVIIKERDLKDQLDKKLQELTSDGSSLGGSGIPTDIQINQSNVGSEVPARALAAAIKEKLQLDDDNDQDILDQHVSRVWSDLTPSRSPGVVTPSQTITSGVGTHGTGMPSQMLRNRYARKERDVHSTFSSDSGNVMDFADSSVSGCPTGMIKSKSMGDYHDSERFLRMGINRRSASKKTFTDLTDSGVSVVSDTPPVPPGPGATVLAATGKDSRVLSWLLESDRSTRLTQNTSLLPNSPTASRHRKGYSHSRSSSLERGSTASNPTSITQQTTILPTSSTLPPAERSLGDRRRGEPAQPFVADPNMPPLPSPHTPTQLEEARRRLLEGDIINRPRVKESMSSQSTLRKGTPSSGMYTTVVFQFCDEEYPYRTRIPGSPVTLKQFKDFLPKKGSYRYFFKTASVELDNQVIQEELCCDTDILPMWEGKVMAQVKPIE